MISNVILVDLGLLFAKRLHHSPFTSDIVGYILGMVVPQYDSNPVLM